MRRNIDEIQSKWAWRLFGTNKCTAYHADAFERRLVFQTSAYVRVRQAFKTEAAPL